MFTSIAASPIKRDAIQVTMYVKTFKTEIIGLIGIVRGL